MKYYYQIYSGSPQGRGVTAKQVIDKLPSADKLDALVVGWSEDVDLYRGLRDYTQKLGKELWLWFPVMAEHSSQASFEQMRLIDGGKLGKDTFDGDEEFDFYCPSDPTLPEKLFGIYDRCYSDIGFDGIFLDRIRAPSMTAGLEALFGCCCERCMEWYAKHGLGSQEIWECYKRLKARAENSSCMNPLGLEEYAAGRYRMEDPVLECFLRLKSGRVTESVAAVAAGFRQRDLKIGMDLFAPFLSLFVGQDYRALAPLADFVKPMLYRLTDTPAGIGYEIRAMADALSGRDRKMASGREKWLYDFYNTEKDGMFLFKQELKAIVQFKRELGVPGRFMPGLEIHTVSELPPLRNRDIANNVMLVERSGFMGRVACWDILSARPDALEAFAEPGRGDSC